MNNVIDCRQDPKSTLLPETWLCLQIYGWENPGFGSERAVVHHTGLREPSDYVRAEIEDSFDETFDIRARGGHD